MKEKIKELNDVTYQFRGSYIQTIFDPIQTHALYGVMKDDAPKAKKLLKEAGASRFRVIKNNFGFAIICFKIKQYGN